MSHLILCGAYARDRNHRGQAEHEMEARRALKTLVRLDWGRSNNDLQRMSASGENAACIMEECDEADVRPLLCSVAPPAVVFHSDRDQAVPIEEGRILATEMPNARLFHSRVPIIFSWRTNRTGENYWKNWLLFCIGEAMPALIRLPGLLLMLQIVGVGASNR